MSSRDQDIAFLRSIADAAFPTRPSRGIFGGRFAAGGTRRPEPHEYVVQDILKSRDVIEAALANAQVDFSPFGDALASAGDVGRADIRLSIAIKRGDRSVWEQAEMMKAHGDLFPPCYCRENDGYHFLYMKLLTDRIPLHDQLFCDPLPHAKRLELATNRLWDAMGENYVPVEGGKASLRWHMEERIIPRTRRAFDALVDADWKCGSITADKLEHFPVELNGHVFSPLAQLLEDAQSLIDRYPPLTVSFCHGDLHMSNVMSNLAGDITLIDPSPKWSPGDYLWDFARYLMWCEIYGFLAIELRGQGASALEVHIGDRDNRLVISTNNPLEHERDLLINLTHDRRSEIAERLGDRDATIRLEFILASAYLSMMEKLIDFEDPGSSSIQQMLICLAYGEKHLMKFRELANCP